MADFSIETELIKQNYKYIAGIDEAGRGPLAGPVIAAAVVLPINEKLFEEINDSKQLTEMKRNELFIRITDNAVAFSSINVLTVRAAFATLPAFSTAVTVITAAL